MWRFLKMALKALLAVTLVLCLVVSIAWAFPGLWLNRSTLFPILRLVGDISGSAERVEVKTRGLSGKAIGLTINDLCWKMDANRICIKRLELDGEVQLFKTEMVKIAKLVAAGGTVDWTVVENKKKETAEETTDLVPSPPAILDRISVQYADVSADEVKLALPSAYIKGKARVVGQLTDKARWTVTANANYQDRAKPDAPIYDAELDAKLESPHALWRGPFETHMSLKGNLPEKTKVTLGLNGNVASKRIEIKGDVALAKGLKKVKSNLQVLLTANVLDVRTTGNADDIVPNVPRLRWDACHAKYDHRPSGIATLDVNCPLAFTGGFCEFEGGICEEVFKSTNATVGAKLVFKPDENKEQTVTGSVDVRADSLFHRIKEGNASIAVNIDGKIADFPKHMNFHTKADLKIASFQNVVRILKQRPWSVPAPLNTLDGTIDLHVDAEGNLIQEGGKIPITVSTNLTSSHQSLKTAGAGQLTLTKDANGKMKSDLDFTLQLDDVTIALPKLSASKPPRAFPDGRFTKLPPTEAEEKTPSNFTYRIKIESREKPLHVLTNLASVPVPLTVRLEIKSGEAPHGLIRISSFPVELFRRKAKIEYLDLQLKSDARYNEIGGRVVVAYTDYTVFITMMGLASAPQIHFESEPPLPEDQVLAVLLFGKKPETLSADQASSVGNTRAAVQNNALNLASMYLLASTPVESIGYDPITGSFNAKIRLADGTSVTVGTDFSQVNQLGFRQRLGSNWAINTYVNDPFAVVNRTLTALLEWSVGY